MKLQVKIEPTGAVLTAADLNVPGQKFSGTVKDNLIEGIFEIEHARYDGKGAPPFPPSFAADPALGKYLRPDSFIESDDPVLVKQRRRRSPPAPRDSWQAAVRLSRWVAENIGYAIPGGGTARKTYDIRAGECGAHSMLLAAFCRAVGIPARVVFGAMYVPNFGGGFGQHGWNEIYMGAGRLDPGRQHRLRDRFRRFGAHPHHGVADRWAATRFNGQGDRGAGAPAGQRPRPGHPPARSSPPTWARYVQPAGRTDLHRPGKGGQPGARRPGADGAAVQPPR